MEKNKRLILTNSWLLFTILFLPNYSKLYYFIHHHLLFICKYSLLTFNVTLQNYSPFFSSFFIFKNILDLFLCFLLCFNLF